MTMGFSGIRWDPWCPRQDSNLEGPLRRGMGVRRPPRAGKTQEISVSPFQIDGYASSVPTRGLFLKPRTPAPVGTSVFTLVQPAPRRTRYKVDLSMLHSTARAGTFSPLA